MSRAWLSATLVSLACLTGFAAEAGSRRIVAPVDRAEERIIPMYGDLPGCADPAVLGSLSSSFNARETKFWGPLETLSYDRIGQLGYRPWGDDTIPRRFCTARVLLNNGLFHRVDYSVRENLGLFARGWNVNWCVSGLDRERSYAPDCKMARP